MARILVGTWMVRYPLGGNLSWSLQWLVGLRALGHEVYALEKCVYPGECFDPVAQAMGDDGSTGCVAVNELLKRHDLEGHWCFVDREGSHFGFSPQRLRELLGTADLFIDLGTHGAWLEQLAPCVTRVLVDGEPGRTQIRWEASLAAGTPPPLYDFYFTNGSKVGSPTCSVPCVGKEWHHVFNPVHVDLFDAAPPPPHAPFTTVMNWQSHSPLKYQGRVFRQKDAEFPKFMDIPSLVDRPMEVAVSGLPPDEALRANGWRVRKGHEATASFDQFVSYIGQSAGEFSVAKQVFVEMRTGWFSDRSAVYLASGRPVVVQDTGFDEQLPCGHGVFTVRNAAEAVDAIHTIDGDYERHSLGAREVAREYLDTSVVLKRFLQEIGQ